MIQKMPQAILIDDDMLIHLVWKSAAQSKGIQLQCFSEPQSFLNQHANYDKTTPIYVDSNLGNGIKGEVIAKQIHDLGFTEVYLETGYPPEQFAACRSWLKGVIGKDPPW